MKIKIMRDDFRFEDVWNLMERDLGSLWKEVDIDVLDFRHRLLSGLNDGTNVFFILEHQNKVLGVGLLGDVEESRASLYGLCVDPLYRGKMLGSQLLHSICRYVKDKNVQFLQAFCSKQSDSFFLKNGFLKNQNMLMLQLEKVI